LRRQKISELSLTIPVVDGLADFRVKTSEGTTGAS